MAASLNYKYINFPVPKKDYKKIELENSINVNVFGYENGCEHPIYLLKKRFEDYMDLLLITDKMTKSHYVYIKDFDRFMHNKKKHKERRIFVRIITVTML